MPRPQTLAENLLLDLLRDALCEFDGAESLVQ